MSTEALIARGYHEARALTQHSTLTARQITEESLKIAADICIYTNTNFSFEEL